VLLSTLCETAYVQCCRQWVEISGLNIDSGMMWLKAEEEVVNRNGITRFQKCTSCENINKNIKLGGSKTKKCMRQSTDIYPAFYMINRAGGHKAFSRALH
jgi:hypothetical protein